MTELQKVVQFFIHNGLVKVDDFRGFLQKFIFPEEPSQRQLDDETMYQLVQNTNKKLQRFNMMVRASMDEITGTRYYVLISTVDNEITQAASHYNPKQIEFFKLILQAIVSDPNGVIDDENLKSLAERASLVTTSRTRSTLPEYRQLFNEWLVKEWLKTVPDGITLGVRSTAELDVFIKQKLVAQPDDLNCRSCNSISIYSKSCPSCGARFHKRCSKMSIDQETGNCKSCKNSQLPSTSRDSIESVPTKRRRIRKSIT